MRGAPACAALWLLACAAPRPPAPAPPVPAPAASASAPAPADAPIASEPVAPAEVERPIGLPRELPVPVPTEIYVSARPIGPGRVRVWINGSDSIEVRADGSDGGALDALATAARAKVGADPRAICAFDKSLSYGTAVGIIDAFKKAGFVRVSLAVQPTAK